MSDKPSDWVTRTNMTLSDVTSQLGPPVEPVHFTDGASEYVDIYENGVFVRRERMTDARRLLAVLDSTGR
jgi:hypothetical protein